MRKRMLGYFLVIGVLSCWWVYPQEHKKLKYEVAVHAQIVPIFALDSLGNPIFDLKKEELELWVNGKPYPIYLLTLHRFEYQEESQEGKSSSPSRVSTVSRLTRSQRKLSVPPMPKRVNFLLIDLSHMRMRSLHRAREITAKLIREGSPHDEFVLLSYNEGVGLKYLGGPDGSKEDLIQKLETLRFDTTHPYFGICRLGGKYFSTGFSNLKYALMTVSGPRAFFLITDRWPGCVVKNFAGINFLEGLSKHINQGGTSINVVYTGAFFYTMHQSGLKIIADTSGGMFYYQPEVQQIVKAIQKTTSAYYEVVFIPKDKKIKTFNIDVKCKRKNVNLHAVKFTQRKKPYALMKSLQKKVFAMDVATGGIWSRTAAEVRKATYNTISSGKTRNRKEKYWKIRVDIPKEIRNKVAEIFLIRFDEGYLDAEIEIHKRVIRREQTLTLQTHGDKKLVYFVIVEPKSTFSIYSQVI